MTPKTRETLASIGLLVLRIGASVPLMLAHGWGKITHFSDRAASFSDPLNVGSPSSLALVVFAEVFCSIAVALGLWTRLAAVPPLIFFTVAFFIQHAPDPFPRKELALIYGVIYLALVFLGGGRYTLDGWLLRRLGGGKG